MRKIILNQLEIFTPFPHEKGIKKHYNDDFDIDNFLHFPILINSDGSIWKHGSLYFLHKLKAYTKPSHKTLDTIASDLKIFKEFCENEEIDYTCATRRALRPTYLYRGHLNNLLKKTDISPNTLKRRMTAVVGFYKYLVDIEGIEFKYPLWESGITSISYKDQYGFKKIKQVETKDVCKVVATSNPDLFDNTILDGGKLHPLTKDEQIILLQALKSIGNTEMTLAFLIALTTGARIQTVFTLKLKHIQSISNSHKGDIQISVGYGTSCDTKYMKRQTLILPYWLYEKIQIYIQSERAVIRHNRAKHIFDSKEQQYIFLNNRGVPYYIAEEDPYKILYKEPLNGGAVRQFITTTLKKQLHKYSSDITFSFHDLRATFGMNLLNKYLDLVDVKQIKLSYALMQVKERMGHSSLEVTQRYLNFKNQDKLKEQTQDAYEQYMKEILT